MHTGDTITVRGAVSHKIYCWSTQRREFPSLVADLMWAVARQRDQDLLRFNLDVPNRQDATSLGEVGLLLDTTDALLEDGRDLGRGGLFGIGACLYRDDGGSRSDLRLAKRNMLARWCNNNIA